MKGHNFKMLFNLNNSIPNLDWYFYAFRYIHKCHISNTQIRSGVKILLINCKFPMTSKLHMLHGVNNPYMVIVNQSEKFHDCTLSRLLEPVYI